MPLELTLHRVDTDTERALRRAAAHAVDWRLCRDELIREAHANGAGVREIARAVGLSHPAVIRIVRLGASEDPAEKGARNEELNKRRTPSREEPTS